jgi:hypothetical protein
MRVAGYLKLPFSGLRMLLIKIRRRGIRVSNRSTCRTRSALAGSPGKRCTRVLYARLLPEDKEEFDKHAEFKIE